MARRRGERDRGKERFWRKMVRRWQRSGVTIRDFCEAHGLSEPSFYGWRRELAKRDEQAGHRRAWPGTPSARRHANDLPTFVPLRVMATEPASALEVVVGAGQVVRVAPGFDAATLRSLLAVLAEAPAC
ncbi:MAG TPA: transposase [Pseudolabrys sp.]|nr:transposase [Pseudolabrys sp.]